MKNPDFEFKNSKKNVFLNLECTKLNQRVCRNLGGEMCLSLDKIPKTIQSHCWEN